MGFIQKITGIYRMNTELALSGYPVVCQQTPPIVHSAGNRLDAKTLMLQNFSIHWEFESKHRYAFIPNALREKLTCPVHKFTTGGLGPDKKVYVLARTIVLRSSCRLNTISEGAKRSVELFPRVQMVLVITVGA